MNRVLCFLRRRHTWSRVEVFERLNSMTVRRTCACGTVREVRSR